MSRVCHGRSESISIDVEKKSVGGGRDRGSSRTVEDESKLSKAQIATFRTELSNDGPVNRDIILRGIFDTISVVQKH